MSQRPYLNGGCGRIILPAEKPAHHALVDDSYYSYPLHINVDRNMSPGVDRIVDLFKFPWPFPDNSFDGALFSHVVEHLGHDIHLVDNSPRAQELAKYQDAWWAFWSEVYRVCTSGSIVHVLCPYATSHGYLGDPSHQRPITEQTFQHSMQPNPDAPFEYATGGVNFRLADVRFGLMPRYQSYAPLPTDDPIIAQQKSEMLDTLLHSQWNVVSDLYVKLEAVK